MSDLAAISTYDDLVAALRARKDELGLSNALCDDLLNRPSGYLDHYIGRADKVMGAVAFTLLCELFAIEFVPRPNPKAAKRMESRWERRNKSQIRVVACQASTAEIEAIKPIIYGQTAQAGGLARAAKLSPAKRKRIAKNAARARWRQSAAVRANARKRQGAAAG